MGSGEFEELSCRSSSSDIELSSSAEIIVRGVVQDVEIWAHLRSVESVANSLHRVG